MMFLLSSSWSSSLGWQGSSVWMQQHPPSWTMLCTTTTTSPTNRTERGSYLIDWFSVCCCFLFYFRQYIFLLLGCFLFSFFLFLCQQDRKPWRKIITASKAVLSRLVLLPIFVLGKELRFRKRIRSYIIIFGCSGITVNKPDERDVRLLQMKKREDSIFVQTYRLHHHFWVFGNSIGQLERNWLPHPSVFILIPGTRNGRFLTVLL